MSPVPKRYRFDNPMPSVEPGPLPVRRPEATVGQSPMVAEQSVQQYAQPQVVHIHQAPPDSTVQRLALGAGMGAGAVASAVYFGPLLIASLTFMTIWLAVLALVIALIVWPIVVIVRSANPDTGRKKGRR